jgi:hypothetical protein
MADHEKFGEIAFITMEVPPALHQVMLLGTTNKSKGFLQFLP